MWSFSFQIGKTKTTSPVFSGPGPVFSRSSTGLRTGPQSTTNNTTKLWVQVQNGNDNSDEEEVEDEKDDDRLETRVSSSGMFFLTSFFVTNFLFVLGMNHTTTGMPDNGGTCQWHWQGREGRCDECSLVMECLVIGFSINIYIYIC